MQAFSSKQFQIAKTVQCKTVMLFCLLLLTKLLLQVEKQSGYSNNEESSMFSCIFTFENIVPMQARNIPCKKWVQQALL